MKQIEDTQKEIKKLTQWDLPDTVNKPDGYDMKSFPEATSSNMMIFMNKINELTEEVNRLKKIIDQFSH